MQLRGSQLQLRELHRIESQGGSEQDILQGTGISRPFLPRLQRQARKTAPATLEAMLREFRYADRSLKEGRGPLPAELLERLMVQSYEPREVLSGKP